MKLKVRARLKGGPGSGNFGHAGRPGKVGGSASGGGSLPQSGRDRVTVDISARGVDIVVDEHIAPLVAQMNKAGLETTHSCSGHVCDEELTSEISYFVSRKGGDAHNKLASLVKSGELEHEWVLEELRTFTWPRYSLHPKLGFYSDIGSLLSTVDNVRKVVHDWDMMLEVISTIEEKGGKGSGHYGHAGRPGKVGGSAPGDGSAVESERFIYTQYLDFGGPGNKNINNRTTMFINDYIDADIEHAMIYVPPRVFEYDVGDEDGIRLYLDDRYKDGIIVHNHPLGISLSTEDVGAAVKYNLRFMVAVGIRPSDGKKVMWSIERDGDDWGMEWPDGWYNTMNDLLPESNNWNELWNDFADITGHEYIEQVIE